MQPQSPEDKKNKNPKNPTLDTRNFHDAIDKTLVDIEQVNFKEVDVAKVENLILKMWNHLVECETTVRYVC